MWCRGPYLPNWSAPLDVHLLAGLPDNDPLSLVSALFASTTFFSSEYLSERSILDLSLSSLGDTYHSSLGESCDRYAITSPKSETSLTEKLIELGGLKAIIEILRSETTTEAKENALSALFRFTDPTNLKSQRVVVDLGVFPLITGLLRADSVTTSARAAALLGDLSMRSMELSSVHQKQSCFGSCFRGARAAACPAHGGLCSVSTTFCLIEAGVLPDLVRLLRGKLHATAYEAIQTLSTLVQEDSPQRGAAVLHKYGAIGPTIEVLSWGSESLKGEALILLEKFFVSTEIVEFYGAAARLPLGQMSSRSIFDDAHLQRKAVKVLLLIERYSRSSTSLVAGITD